MAKAGHEVSVICGSGRQFSPNIKTVVLEDLDIASPSVTAAQAELWNGYPAAGYFGLVQKLREYIEAQEKSAAEIKSASSAATPEN